MVRRESKYAPNSSSKSRNEIIYIYIYRYIYIDIDIYIYKSWESIDFYGEETHIVSITGYRFRTRRITHKLSIFTVSA